MLASTLSYYVAVALVAEGVSADYPDWISFTGASVAGAALVMLSVIFLAPARLSTRLIVLGLAAGLIGGPVTAQTIGERDLPPMIGYMSWHALIGLALYLGTEGKVSRAKNS